MDPAVWVERYGDALFRYAVLHVGNRSDAEELVQQTLLAGIAGLAGFSGQSSIPTWLTGILKNKTLDFIRRRMREIPVSELTDAGLEGEIFDKSGKWQKLLGSPRANPRESAENGEFWAVFLDCLSRLPPAQAYAFSLREVDGLTTEEVCKELGVSKTNLWTLLHRARLRLRKGLEEQGFGG